MRDLSDFIDQFLSLPFDTRRDCISIAEKNFKNIEHSSYDIYNYIYWRVNLPMNHTSSWHDLFDKDVAGHQESL
jgi:hypothetical protein